MQEQDKKFFLPPGLTFGMEIETDPSEASVTKPSDIFKLFGRIFPGSYHGESLLFEISSEILYGDNTKIRDSVYKICEGLKSIGHKVSGECGGHIHFGARYMKSVSAVQNLLELHANTEKILFLIGNAPGDFIRETGFSDGVKKQMGYGAASPISKSLQTNLTRNYKKVTEIGKAESPDKYRKEIFCMTLRPDNSQEGHYNSLNIYTCYPTVEFRIPNGTLDPDVWIENINLFGGMVRVAQELAEIQKKPIEERTKEENEKMACLVRINRNSTTDQERLEALLQLTIPEEQERDCYRKRYIENLSLLEQSNPSLSQNLNRQISSTKIHLNPENYRESILLQGISVEELQKRIHFLIDESIWHGDRKCLESDVLYSVYPNLNEFQEVYLTLLRTRMDKKLFEDLDMEKISLEELSNRARNIIEQKRLAEEQEKLKQEELQREEQRRKEEISSMKDTVSIQVAENSESCLSMQNDIKSQEQKFTLWRKQFGMREQEDGQSKALTSVFSDIAKNLTQMQQNSIESEDLESLMTNKEILEKVGEIIGESSTFTTNYQQELMSDFSKDFYIKIHEIIKASKLAELDKKISETENEKISIFDKLLGKNRVKQAKIKNLMLQKQIISETELPEKEEYSMEESLADLYAYVQTELNGQFTPEMQVLLNTLQENKELNSSINKEKMDFLVTQKVQENSDNAALIESPQKRGFFRYRKEESKVVKQNEDLEQQLQQNRDNRKQNGDFLSEWKKTKKHVSIEKLEDSLKRISEITQQDNSQEEHINDKKERSRIVIYISNWRI